MHTLTIKVASKSCELPSFKPCLYPTGTGNRGRQYTGHMGYRPSQLSSLLGAVGRLLWLIMSCNTERCSLYLAHPAACRCTGSACGQLWWALHALSPGWTPAGCAVDSAPLTEGLGHRRPLLSARYRLLSLSTAARINAVRSLKNFSTDAWKVWVISASSQHNIMNTKPSTFPAVLVSTAGVIYSVVCLWCIVKGLKCWLTPETGLSSRWHSPDSLTPEGDEWLRFLLMFQLMRVYFPRMAVDSLEHRNCLLSERASNAVSSHACMHAGLLEIIYFNPSHVLRYHNTSVCSNVAREFTAQVRMQTRHDTSDSVFPKNIWEAVALINCSSDSRVRFFFHFLCSGHK